MITSFDLETAGTDPLISRITCIGFGSKDSVTQFGAYEHKDEEYMLRQADIWMKERIWDNQTLLTYNGRHFDLPFLTVRGALYGLTFDYFKPKHIDLMPFATALNNGSRISKDLFLSKYLNMYVPRTCSGAWLARQYSTGKITMDGHLQNLQHNLQDLLVTLRAHEELLKFDDYNNFCKTQFEMDLIKTVEVKS